MDIPTPEELNAAVEQHFRHLYPEGPLKLSRSGSHDEAYRNAWLENPGRIAGLGGQPNLLGALPRRPLEARSGESRPQPVRERLARDQGRDHEQQSASSRR